MRKAAYTVQLVTTPVAHRFASARVASAAGRVPAAVPAALRSTSRVPKKLLRSSGCCATDAARSGERAGPPPPSCSGVAQRLGLHGLHAWRPLLRAQQLSKRASRRMRLARPCRTHHGSNCVVCRAGALVGGSCAAAHAPAHAGPIPPVPLEDITVGEIVQQSEGTESWGRVLLVFFVFVFLVVPAMLLLASLIFGALLADAEGWAFPDGFLYVIVRAHGALRRITARPADARAPPLAHAADQSLRVPCRLLLLAGGALTLFFPVLKTGILGAQLTPASPTTYALACVCAAGALTGLRAPAARPQGPRARGRRHHRLVVAFSAGHCDWCCRLPLHPRALCQGI